LHKNNKEESFLNPVRQLTFTSLFIACGIILPIFFHFMSMSGTIFLPMHIPVLIGGLLLGWRSGLIIGITAPILSSLLTGMPPIFPLTPMMIVELSLYGITAGYLYNTQKFPLLISLFTAMIAGRLGTALTLALFADSLGIHIAPLSYIYLSLAKGSIGIIIQLCLIPLLMKFLNKYFKQNEM
jgi:riboflavin transporter FmnP